MARRISVVVSQGQSHNPRKRQLEEELVTALMFESGIDTAVIPNLYDVQSDGTSALALQGISGDLIVVSWLYERAARWTLDRLGVRGKQGVSTINAELDEDESEENDAPEQESDEKSRVADDRPMPQRRIYCLELTASESAADFMKEVRRIQQELTTSVVELDGLGSWVSPTATADKDALNRFENPTNDTALGPNGSLSSHIDPPTARNVIPQTNGQNGAGHNDHSTNGSTQEVNRIDESADRRWYPVIDFSRCTNCMECIDFCLFGVYGIDGAETILVEQPDNCRKGCPACSRVCPENAIIFPQHKSPAIAGAPAEVGTLKIDLSRLFGAPDAVELAARERDEQLVLAGRDAVGMSVGVPKRQSDEETPRDELDDLIDGLDELDI